jgi:threonine aldolase
VLSFGGTKNGALGAEAVIVMKEDLGTDTPFQRKQQMQLASKMRYLAAQFSALLDDSLWLRSASHANAMATRLAEGVSGLPGVELRQPVDSNAVFVALAAALISALQRDWGFDVWDPAENLVRWMTAFDTTEEDVDAFVAAVRAVAVAR